MIDPSTNATKTLSALRKLSTEIITIVESKKPLDPRKALVLAKTLQDLDAWIAQGGDAPDQWTADDDVADVDGDPGAA